MNNFSFFTDEQVLVTGPIVSHAGESAVWARQITKGGKTLTLRSPDGSPRWPTTAEDPDGCGISHDVFGIKRRRPCAPGSLLVRC
jgi:hypothetical protein